MSIRDLIPAIGKSHLPVRRTARERGELDTFHQAVNRMFDEFLGGWEPFGASLGLAPFAGERWPDFFAQGLPRVNVSETDEGLQVSAELPGYDKDDVNVELTDGQLVLRAKREEKSENKERHWHRQEYCRGECHRTVPLPEHLDTGKATASFKRGILDIRIPRKEGAAPSRRLIHIESD